MGMENIKTAKNGIGSGKAGPGRPKGTPNKTTSLLRDAILAAAEKAGGVEGTTGYLATQAKENPAAFMSLLGKVLPMQVANAEGETFKTENTGGAASKLAALVTSIAERRGIAG